MMSINEEGRISRNGWIVGMKDDNIMYVWTARAYIITVNKKRTKYLCGKKDVE